MIISIIARIAAALYSNKRPGEVAAGVALALWAALIPSGSPLFWAVFLIIFFVKVNQALALLALAVLTPLAALSDPLLHSLGYTLLTHETLHGMWVALYEVPLMPLTRFNDTVVMGGFAAGLLLFPLVFLLVRSLIIPIRTRLVPRIAGSKLMQRLYKSPKIAKLIAAFQKWNGYFEAIGG